MKGTTEIRRENLRNLSSVSRALEKRDLGSAMTGRSTAVPKEIACAWDAHRVRRVVLMQRESFLGLTQVLAIDLLIFVIMVFISARSRIRSPFGSDVLCGSGRSVHCGSLELAELLLVHGRHHGGRHRSQERNSHVDRNSILGERLELREAIYHAGRRRLLRDSMTALRLFSLLAPLASAGGSAASC
jgi:Cu/Ag efflux pump CusA